jgi:hypothetical protein
VAREHGDRGLLASAIADELPALFRDLVNAAS